MWLPLQKPAITFAPSTPRLVPPLEANEHCGEARLLAVSDLIP